MKVTCIYTVPFSYQDIFHIVQKVLQAIDSPYLFQSRSELLVFFSNLQTALKLAYWLVILILCGYSIDVMNSPWIPLYYHGNLCSQLDFYGNRCHVYKRHD